MIAVTYPKINLIQLGFASNSPVVRLGAFEYPETLNFIDKNIVNATDSASRKKKILTFKQKYSDVYKFGDDKWQNPRYHQYTVTDHMLRTMEEASKIVRGTHEDLKALLTPDQKARMLKTFNEKIDGINKGTLYVLAMAFHDMDKFFDCKPRRTPQGNIMKVDPEMCVAYSSDCTKAKDQAYWSFEDNSFEAVKEFRDLARKMRLPQNATDYVCMILEHHDNPLKHIVWAIENGEKNITRMFDNLKHNTPIPLNELAYVYLADQSGKGEKDWTDKLEAISPWKCIFKSMVAERPLAELDILLEKIKPRSV